MSYPGRKGQAGTWHRIIGNMPPHTVYVEPFFGSGQIYWRKRPAAHNVIIDADTGVIAAFDADHRHKAPTRAMVGNALDILPTLDLPPDAVVYCDPPYVLSTRKGRVYYEHEMSDLQHRRMLALLQALPCRVMLSGYPNAIYDAGIRDWRCEMYQTRTRGRTLTECLWCNFPPPIELHDYRFAGKTFRERLQFKRLATRWLARLDAMPPVKRGFVLEALRDRTALGLGMPVPIA
jgi:hypothetical protein